MNQTLFNQLKMEIKTHTITYILTKYEMLGIDLTEAIIARIKGSKTFKEFMRL